MEVRHDLRLAGPRHVPALVLELAARRRLHEGPLLRSVAGAEEAHDDDATLRRLQRLGVGDELELLHHGAATDAHDDRRSPEEARRRHVSTCDPLRQKIGFSHAQP